MKKTMMLVVAGVLAAMFAFAQDAEIVKVRGKGVGTDKTEALKDAYRDAVERAVGLYVDAEQMMKNEELVKDQILTQSNAYIEKYDVAKETAKPNGLVEVQILAEVRKTVLAKKISDVMPEKKYALSDGLEDAHAKLTTLEKRGADGVALLEKALKDFNPFRQSIDISLASTEGVVGGSNAYGKTGTDAVQVNYLLKMRFDSKRFFEKVSFLKEVLDQISVITSQEVTIDSGVLKTSDVASLVSEAKKNALTTGFFPRGQDGISIKLPLVAKGGNKVLLVAKVNKYGTYSGYVYQLSDDTLKIVRQWTGSFWNGDNVRYRITLMDADGQTIKSIESSWSYNPSCARRTRFSEICQTTMLAPWFDGPNVSGGAPTVISWYAWEKIALPKDALPEVKDMKIEIVK